MWRLPKINLIITMGVLAILVGIIAITGWEFHIEILTSALPGFPTMKFNTALGFIITGATLLLVRMKKEGLVKSVARLLALALIILGASVLPEYIFHINNHLDQLFISDNFELSGGLPGRMAAGTALSFILCGIGYISLTSNISKIQSIGQYCFHFVTLLATIAILGYLFQVPPFYKFLMLNSMALHTAMGFFILSLASTSVYPNAGLTALFTGHYTGNLMARNLFPRLVLATVALAYLRIEYNRHYPLADSLGIALFGTAVIVIGLFLIWQTGIWLNSMDKKRALAEETISALNKDLEKTVEKRTEDLKASLKKLGDSEESFRMLVEGVVDYAIYMIDPAGRIMNWNKGAQNIYGYTADEVIGQSVAILFTDSAIEQGEPEYSLETATEKQHYESEGWRVRKDGTKFWANVLLTPLYEQGALKGFSKLTRDITTKKNAEEISLREAALVQTIPFGIVYGRKNGLKITSMNKAAEDLFGIALADARDTQLSAIVNMQIIGSTLAEVERELWDAKGYWQGEVIFTTMDGRRLTVLATLKTMHHLMGGESNWLGIFSDITTLKTTEERLELAFEGTSAGLWDWDIQRDKRWWSPRYYELLGYENNEIDASRESLKHLLHPDDYTMVFTILQRNLSKPGMFELEARYKTKNNGYRWFHAVGKTRFGDNGQPLRMVGSITDIDEKKKAQQLNSQQAELIKMLPDGIIYGTMANRVISLNEGAETLFEINATDAAGKKLEDLISVMALGNENFSRKELLKKGFLRAELVLTNRSGKKVTVLANVKLLADIAGHQPAWICVYTDITPLRLNEKLKKALEKLEVSNQYLEQLAHISAHDIKAPIIALKGLSDVLSVPGAVSPDFAVVMRLFINKVHQLQQTNNALNNILKLRKNLISKEDGIEEFVALRVIWNEICTSLSDEMQSDNARIEASFNGLDKVRFPYINIKNILYNLTSNSLKYRNPARNLLVLVEVKQYGEHGFTITVADNGLGIDMQLNKDKLFGIFKRFHNHIDGTGIGLHIVKSIVDAYAGQIEVESEIEHGTRIKIIFPHLSVEYYY